MAAQMTADPREIIAKSPMSGIQIAVVVITIALLALMASYDQAFFSLHAAARKSAATSLAENYVGLETID